MTNAHDAAGDREQRAHDAVRSSVAAGNEVEATSARSQAAGA